MVYKQKQQQKSISWLSGSSIYALAWSHNEFLKWCYDLNFAYFHPLLWIQIGLKSMMVSLELYPFPNELWDQQHFWVLYCVLPIQFFLSLDFTN